MRDGAILGNAVDLAALSLRPWSSRVDACPGTLPQHADPALGREDLPGLHRFEDNGADAKTEQTDSAGQVRAIQTLYSLQRAIDNGPDRKIKHEKSS